MHICMVAFSDLRFDYRIYREAFSLVEAGHKITVFCTAFDKQPIEGWENIKIHLLQIDRSQSLRKLYPLFWRWAFKRLKSINADVFHAHDLDTLLPCAWAARRFNKPLIYDSHEFWTEQSSLVNRPLIQTFWTQLEKHLIPKVDRIITVSQAIAHSLNQKYPDAPSATVIRNLPLYQSFEKSNRIRSELNISRKSPVVLYQGGFLFDNGLREQIKAAKGFGNAVFVLIGSGPCEKELKSLVAKEGLREKVFFIDRVPFSELHSYTCSADLGLCLIKNSGRSFYHSLPNKLFEYIMGGLPIIGSNFPEIENVINKTGVGTTLDPTDIDCIALEVRNILKNQQDLSQKHLSAISASKIYNWEKESDVLLKLYSEL